MAILIVTNNTDDWPTESANIEIVDAERYLTDPQFSDLRGAKVFNLCRSYRYQTTGYYVSLLAEARGHKPLPNVSTVRDIKTQSVVRMVSSDLDDLIQKSLAQIKSAKFKLSIYFGHNLVERYRRLALNLFNQFQCPLLRAEFVRDSKNHWHLKKVDPISGNDVPKSHWSFVIKAANVHFAGRRPSSARKTPRFDLAILHKPDDPRPPSDSKALKKFVRAAESLNIAA
jgi:hypothetical protein